MRILIITQNEPFFLSSNLEYLFSGLPDNQEIIGAIITPPSPFGKKESFIQKAIKTFRIFGFKFFFYYSVQFVYSKIFKKSIKQRLKQYNIPEIVIEGSINSKINLEKIQKLNPDLIISILGNQIFKKTLLNIPKYGCINLHTALLPKYRGLMPTFWVLKNNEPYTGVSIFFMDEGIDSGPILLQEVVETGNKTQQQLIKETKLIGIKLILDSITMIQDGAYQLISNPDKEKSYYSFPTKADVIQFKKIGKRFF